MIDEHVTDRQKLWIEFVIFFENIYVAGKFCGYSRKECRLLWKSRKIKKYIRKRQRYYNYIDFWKERKHGDKNT
jgi:hypothetical protein